MDSCISDCNTALLRVEKIFREKDKKVGKTFVNRNENVVPLHRQNERATALPLIENFARIKSKNCAH